MADDLKWVDQFRNGDEKAFNELIHRYKKPIYYVILRMVRNHDDAIDLAQDTFVRAYRHIQSFKGESGFYTWLCRIAVNLSVNHINRNKTRFWESFEDVPKPVKTHKGNPSESLDREELQTAIDKAIVSLPEKQRVIFILRYYEEMSHQKIANLLGKSVGTIKAGYFHAVKKLQQELADYERGV
ncbi:MAG: hypothetical protein B6244_10335 [Candidatus Cloacimonetes bacterium 4572_55]|nr:MAG: hypothetical protein B6244_10335 [Candidatus Cloacimonetes bacterium 4572_55]